MRTARGTVAYMSAQCVATSFLVIVENVHKNRDNMSYGLVALRQGVVLTIVRSWV